MTAIRRRTDLPAAAADPGRHAAESLTRGSSSFAAAARLLSPDVRESVTLLYAWCRTCDDVVDGQDHGGAVVRIPADPVFRVRELEVATRRALAGEPTGLAAFDGLARVVDRHDLPHELPLFHLSGYRMDAENRRYHDLDDLLGYCWGVAGVVGAMMARLLGASGADTFARASDLGIAFQMTNIARDVVDDARAGRLYIPRRWLAEGGLPDVPEHLLQPRHRPALAAVATRLVRAAEPYYASALVGIGRLPLRSAIAIGAARDVYRAIGTKVAARGPSAWDERVRTRGGEKARFVLSGSGRALLAKVGGSPDRPRDPDLWTPPFL